MEKWIEDIIVWSVPFITAVTWHEVSHGYVAYLRGDKTAKDSQRLKWNPIYHFDGIGTIIIPILMILLNSGIVFGWCKSLPVNLNVLKNPKTDRLLVAIAGIAMNVALAFFWAIILMFGQYLDNQQLYQLSHILVRVANCGLSINIIIILVNLIPVLPLDGGRILECFLNKRLRYFLSWTQPFGLILAVGILAYGGTKAWIIPAHQYMNKWFIETTDAVYDKVVLQADFSKLWQTPQTEQENP